MSSPASKTPPPDRPERERALDTGRSVLVQAPAGSGKTDLLTRRFLRLLGEVDDPGEIVAITFTKAAAAEMRHRILSKLEEAAAEDRPEPGADEFSMETLAASARARSRALDWKLLDLPARLRISTIDSFCREIALQQPLVSGLGGGLDIATQPMELYRRAARRTLEQIGKNDAALSAAIEALLLWRDNGWQEMENLLVEMLAERDRWMHDFVLDREPDWEALRERLERPFFRAVSAQLTELSQLLDQAPGAREEALELARFACEQTQKTLHQELAELAEFPAGPFNDAITSEEARHACVALAGLLLTNEDGFRKQVDKRLGFPADRKGEKGRLLTLVARLGSVPGIESALASARKLPPARYTEEDWQIVRACFVLLRRAAAELKVVFAEAAAVDYIEVAQIAQKALEGEDNLPTDAAQTVADGIRHLLVDEFQDTSRRQHELLRRLIAAWPEREGRTCFVVGDPMQSIYFFRDADAELFPRVEELGLEIAGDLPLRFDPVLLRANFRAAPPLVQRLNDVFDAVFKTLDGSGVTFSKAEPARAERGRDENEAVGGRDPRMELHVEFAPDSPRGKSAGKNASEKKKRIGDERKTALEKQTAEIVAVIRGHWPQIERTREENKQKGEGEKKKYRVAVLGRTRKALTPVAEALRQANDQAEIEGHEKIPFRAVELENLKDRPEILDALALARALLNPQDRVAWLGVLRAPWCGLSLADLHTLAGGDDAELLTRPVPELLAERIQLLSKAGRAAAERVLRAMEFSARPRSRKPALTLGTWLEQVWLRLGGAQCADAAARTNLDLLWKSIDALPEGEPDLLGTALDATLGNLKAQPDPAADSDCGVQLMTIHAAKGLEFEVVIVPDLQAGTTRSHGKLLSWLERGLPPDDKSGEPEDAHEITEFLVAPLQPKGADRGKAKEWVDRVYRERESQEMRRILYVACTRAREELHLFARPAYKTEKNLARTLVEPKESLLATAWPALEDEIRTRFVEWRQETGQREIEGGELSEPADFESGETTIEALAASGDGNLCVMPSPPEPAKPTLLRRLPPDFPTVPDQDLAAAASPAILGMSASSGMNATQLYKRHEGGLLVRALGLAVHSLLQELTHLRQTQDWEQAQAALSRLEPRIVAGVRAAGVERAQADRIATQALEIVLQAAADPVGAWILSPHAEAASEARWAGVVAGGLHTVQVDRVFRAGLRPRSEGDDAWWIIDYKTAHADGLDPNAALPALREIFAPQIEAYAQILGNLHPGIVPVRAGLYYPRMSRLDWWEI